MRFCTEVLEDAKNDGLEDAGTIIYEVDAVLVWQHVKNLFDI